MSTVQSFSAVTPPPRYDSVPWATVEILEAAVDAGPFALIDTQAIAVDPSPESPNSVPVTTSFATLEIGWYRFRFVDGFGNVSTYTDPVVAPAGALSALYCTPSDVRDELDATFATLSDTTAFRLIVSSCDLIDRILGAGWWADETSGRKVAEDDVEPWQWAKLRRATTLLAVRLHNDPTLTTSLGATTVKGPDFEITGPHGGAAARLFGTEVLAILDDSGLRQLAGRARAGRHRRAIKPGYDRFLRATRHNGT